MSNNRLPWWTVAIVVVMLEPHSCRGQGRLMEPPSRSSMWRLGFNNPPNFHDNSLNCGGPYRLWYVNQGKCGVCGDPWDQPKPRQNEDGGLYGNGIITRNYVIGQVMDVSVEMAKTDGGWFEFRLCPRESSSSVLTQDCLDQNPLPLAEGDGSTRYQIGNNQSTGFINMKVRLPAEITCTYCVIQWKYGTASDKGGDSRIHEEYYGCADVAIFKSKILAQLAWPAPAPAGSVQCHAVGFVGGNSEFDDWCKRNCHKDRPCSPEYCDPSCNAETGSSQTSEGTTSVGMDQSTQNPFISCVAINSWAGDPKLDLFCTIQCFSGKCLQSYCSCSTLGSLANTQIQTTPSPTSTTTLSTFQTTQMTNMPQLSTTQPTSSSASPTASSTVLPSTTPTPVCHAINSWRSIPLLESFCIDKCTPGACPYHDCQCDNLTTTNPTVAQTIPLTSASSLSDISVPSALLACQAIGAWSGRADLDKWCTQACNKFVCDSQRCMCTKVTTPPSTHVPTTNLAVSTVNASHCFAIGRWKGDPMIDLWCSANCPNNPLCDVNTCACETSSTSTHVELSSPSIPVCHASSIWANVTELDEWCAVNCTVRNCPPDFCDCGAVSTPLTSSQLSIRLSTTSSSRSKCHGASEWQDDPEMNIYCANECPDGNCVPQFCQCDP